MNHDDPRLTQHVLSEENSAEMTEALILELLLMTGLLIVCHWCRIHAPPTAR